MKRIVFVASLTLLSCEPPPNNPHTDDTDPIDDTDAVAPERPDLSYTAGTCGALVAPADLSTEAARAAARELLQAVDPNHLPGTAGFGHEARWADASLCTGYRRVYGWTTHVDAPDGCLAEDDSWWWGEAEVTWALQRFSATADRLSTIAPDGALLQLDGALRWRTTGQTGNPSFEGSADVYVRSGEEAWYVVFDKPTLDPEATGYVHHIAGEAGPLGDFCFEATYEGRSLTAVSFNPR